MNSIKTLPIATGSARCCWGGQTKVNLKRDEEMMTNQTTQTNTMVLNVPDITCGGCANSIKRALGNVAGVSEVMVDVNTKKVIVEHNNGSTRENIVDALEKAGFAAE